MTTTKIEHGAVVIPAELRERFGLEEGTAVVVEGDERGLRVRRAYPAPEMYTPERKAEFLLSNAMDEQDYAWAIEEVRRMGLDPDLILHVRPRR